MTKFLPLVFLVSAFFGWLALTNLTLFAYPENFAYPFFVEGGMLPYRDIIDQHFPGLFFFPLNWRSLGVLTLEQVQVAMMIIFALATSFLFAVAWVIYRDLRLSFLAAVFYALWFGYFGGNFFWVDHLLPLFLIPAFYFGYRFFLVEAEAKNIFLTGVFLGLATIFKPTGLVLALVVTLLLYWRKEVRPIYFLALGLLFPIGAMLLYFFRIGVLGDFFRWAVVFNLSEYGRLAAKLPQVGQLTGVFVASIFPLIFFIQEGRRGDFFYLTLWTLPLLTGLFPRFELFHFYPSLPFFSLISAISALRLWQRRSAWKKVVPLLVFIAILLVQFRFFVRNLTGVHFFFRSYHYQAADFILENTQPGEPLFVFGGQDQLYPLSQRLPPAKFYVPQLPWYYSQEGIQERVVTSLGEDSPPFVLYVVDAGIDGQSLTEYGKIVFGHLKDNYQPTEHQFGPIQVWEKK